MRVWVAVIALVVVGLVSTTTWLAIRERHYTLTLTGSPGASFDLRVSYRRWTGATVGPIDLSGDVPARYDLKGVNLTTALTPTAGVVRLITEANGEQVGFEQGGEGSSGSSTWTGDAPLPWIPTLVADAAILLLGGVAVMWLVRRDRRRRAGLRA